MSPLPVVQKTPIGVIEAEGRRYSVTLHIMHDGVEYLGELWFADTSWQDEGFLDRGVFPGRSPEEVLALALRLTDEELALRFRRGNAEKRRYHALRRVTTELLERIRYLNRVAVSMRTGMLEMEAARQELDLTEQQLIELVTQAKNVAGVEG